MKKGFSILSLLFALTLPMFGQTGDFDFPTAESYLGIFANQELRLAKKLHLNAQQRLRLDEINNVYVSKAAALKIDKSIDRADRRAQDKALKVNRENQFIQLLDSEQLVLWKKSGAAKRNFRKKPK